MSAVAKPSKKTSKKVSSTKKKSKTVIGWREWIHLPDMSKRMVKAKIDTGARTSAIHAEDIKIFRRGQKRLVRFKLLPDQKSDRKSKVVEMEMVEKRKVRSSIGHESVRPVVKTVLKIGEYAYPIELTLVNRDIMGFRMLIGRQALKEKFLIDPHKSFLVSKELNRKSLHKSHQTS